MRARILSYTDMEEAEREINSLLENGYYIRTVSFEGGQIQALMLLRQDFSQEIEITEGVAQRAQTVRRKAVSEALGYGRANR